MQVQVYPKRRNGFLLPDREQRSGQPIRGDLVIEKQWITETKTRRAAVIRRAGSPNPKDVHAILFDPEIKSAHGALLYLTGWEVIDHGREGKQLVLQEWPCEIVGF